MKMENTHWILDSGDARKLKKKIKSASDFHMKHWKLESGGW